MGIDNIVVYFSITLLLIASIVLYVMLAGKVLPHFVFKQRYKRIKCKDRGLKKFIYPEGRGISYEPQPSMRKYVPLYILFSNNGYKYIKCKLDSRIRTIEYDIYLFDNKNRIIDVLGVFETLARRGECREVMLHPDTSYVSLFVKRVDGREVDSSSPVYYKLRDALLYFLSSVLLTFTELLFLRVGFNEYMRTLSGMEDKLGLGFGTLCFAALVIGGLFALIVMRTKCTGGVKVVWHDTE